MNENPKSKPKADPAELKNEVTISILINIDAFEEIEKCLMC